MRMKGFIAALSATALVVPQTAVIAQTSAAAPAAVAPASEDVEGNELRGGFILPLAVIIAILLALKLTDTWPFDDDEPRTP
jgi:type VI protein secretion system component VasF